MAKHASKTEAREATSKSPIIIVLGKEMHPKMDPGGISLACGAALARQEAARRTKSPAQVRPKSAKKRL